MEITIKEEHCLEITKEDIAIMFSVDASRIDIQDIDSRSDIDDHITSVRVLINVTRPLPKAGDFKRPKLNKKLVFKKKRK